MDIENKANENIQKESNSIRDSEQKVDRLMLKSVAGSCWEMMYRLENISNCKLSDSKCSIEKVIVILDLEKRSVICQMNKLIERNELLGEGD